MIPPLELAQQEINRLRARNAALLTALRKCSMIAFLEWPSASYTKHNLVDRLDMIRENSRAAIAAGEKEE